MVKTVAMYANSKSTYFIHLFVDSAMQLNLSNRNSLSSLKPNVHVLFHKADTEGDLPQRFRMCATERLHLPKKMLDLDAVIYVDTDTLWQVDPAEMWKFFSHFKSRQSLGVALAQEAAVPRSENPDSLENRPFLVDGKWGVNGLQSGVMMWNLTRARQFQEGEKFVNTVLHPPFELALPDQDALNIYANKEPSRVFLLPCAYNLRSTSRCIETPAADKPAIVHGNMGLFHQLNACVGNRPLRAMFDAALSWQASEPRPKWPTC